MRQGGDQVLSARQEQVARLAAEGLTNQQIARELFLSPKTVDKHVSAAMRKVGARSRTELARHFPRTTKSRNWGFFPIGHPIPHPIRLPPHFRHARNRNRPRRAGPGRPRPSPPSRPCP
ncbi:response regulator transcription factor [Nonomuraea antimicrobica]